MHTNNRLWLKELRKSYPKSFTKAKVLELGSGDTTKALVIRSYFKKCKYIGVDRVGKEHGVYGVDVIQEAKKTKFKKNFFDAFICFSMFEHDPEWRQSLSHNLQYLKSGGMLFISFGSEGNRRHDPEPWRYVSYKVFLKFCSKLPIKVMDAFFEEERYGYDCSGVFNFVAQKSAAREKNLESFTSVMVKLVPPRPPLKILVDNFLYYAVRFKIKLINAIPFKRKYFYSE